MIEIIAASSVSPQELLRRRVSSGADVSGAVSAIIDDVRQNGDEAVRRYTEKFDGARLECLMVPQNEIEEAAARLDGRLFAVMQKAADNIRDFHSRQLRQGFAVTDRPGIVMGQRVLPLEKVGVYVPGGTAAYPSTVLMDVIPAQLAGVRQIIMATPPDTNGRVAPAILAAAALLGIRDIVMAGGAQAVAALAYGTESIPRVDKIVGPGNLYVATAKRLVFGQVGIDMFAGPSDILVVADESAAPVAVAADMLGQAEHDINAAAVLITTSAPLAQQVLRELETRIKRLPRREIAEASLKANGCIMVAHSIEEAIETANGLAPEHLELCVKEPFALLPLVRSAGSVFLGHYTPEALGDYFAGPNHTLPTGGAARFSSPLSVDDFVKKSSYLYYSKQALRQAGDDVTVFARAEGLCAHAESVAVREDADV